MIGRYRETDDDWTALERQIHDAVMAVLSNEEFSVAEAPSSDGFILTAPDGSQRWLEFAVAERPMVEPAIGTVVEAVADGCRRRGPVILRGPGFFSFRFQYKNGLESSGVVVSGDAYTIVEVA